MYYCNLCYKQCIVWCTCSYAYVYMWVLCLRIYVNHEMGPSHQCGLESFSPLYGRLGGGLLPRSPLAQLWWSPWRCTGSLWTLGLALLLYRRFHLDTTSPSLWDGLVAGRLPPVFYLRALVTDVRLALYSAMDPRWSPRWLPPVSSLHILAAGAKLALHSAVDPRWSPRWRLSLCSPFILHYLRLFEREIFDFQDVTRQWWESRNKFSTLRFFPPTYAHAETAIRVRARTRWRCQIVKLWCAEREWESQERVGWTFLTKI